MFTFPVPTFSVAYNNWTDIQGDIKASCSAHSVQR